MKKRNIAILLLSLLVSSCSNSQVSNEPGAITPPSGGDDVVEVDDSNIASVKINESEQYLLLNKKAYLTVTISTKNGSPLTDEENQVTWTSIDPSIASVSKYGVVTANSLGSTYIIVETPIGHKRDRILINVVSSVDSITRRYERMNMSDLDTLKDGDIICFACPEKGLTFTTIEESRSLTSISSTFSSDKSYISTLGEKTAEFIIGYDNVHQGWTLENQDGYYLNAANTKKVSWVTNKGNIFWDIFEDIDSGELYIESTSAVIGRLMYNESADKFTLYDSSVQIDMFVPTIYRLTIVK